VDEELLRLAFGSLRKQAAPGVDAQSYADYAANLDENLKDLYARLKSGRYRAPVIRRVYIPKANGKLRALGITTIEDRMVQNAVAWVLSVVFEHNFLDCSYGFRPNRSAHGALHQLREGMMQHWARYVVEVDVVNYFGAINWEWLRKFVRHRVNCVERVKTDGDFGEAEHRFRDCGIGVGARQPVGRGTLGCRPR
jgi:retron-type reverse transcriptase